MLTQKKSNQRGLKLTVVLLVLALMLFGGYHWFTVANMKLDLSGVARGVGDITAHLQSEYDAQGSWPKPGYQTDDSLFPYLESKAGGGNRVDTYGSFSGNFEIDFILSLDGEIIVRLREAEDTP